MVDAGREPGPASVGGLLKPRDPANVSLALEDKTFLILLISVSLAFGWILWPFYGAVFWGVVLAILFAPLYRRLLRAMRFRRTPAALATLAIIVVIVILPLTLITAALVQQGAGIYQMIQSGEVNFPRYFEQILGVLPDWVTALLDRFGVFDIGSMQQKLAAGVTQGSQFLAKQALGIGQNTLDFVIGFFITLYLAFFLIRDGGALAGRMKEAIPLDAHYKRSLFRKFTTVVRATVKGNVVIAIVQGVLGGIAFWFLGINGVLLWGVLMAFLSLLPAVGAALVWVPVALYLLATGAVGHGIGLVAYGVLVMGLVDNLLRPILVGKDTKLPDYVVLISTLGGMAIFGINGFVIGPMIAAMFMAVWDIFVVARAAEESRADPLPAPPDSNA
ncbi:MAG: AI-2E family transporter [Gammaproteobacteria bacterium]